MASTAGGGVRPCLHKEAAHEHGTNAAYHLDACRCRPCSAAAVAYDRRRSRLIAYGRWEPFVDAEPARQHVATLRASGLGLKRIAVLSGVPHGGLWKLVYGRRGSDGMKVPSRRIRRETHAALLAVQPGQVAPSGGALIDATGTRRRLQALVAVGWSQSKLAARLGMERSNFGLVLTRRQVQASTAAAVLALYDLLEYAAPPEATHRDRIAASRARSYASVRGWLAPGWWDGDTLDDPSYDPRDAEPVCDVDPVAIERVRAGDRTVRLTALERTHAAEVLHRQGLSPNQIATQLRMSHRHVKELLPVPADDVAVAAR